MMEVHQGTTSELLSRLIVSSTEPVTLIVPSLPSAQLLDQAIIIANQHARKLRVITSLYGSGPVSTRRQIDALVRLGRNGVKLKVAERGVLPSFLVAPPSGCCILPVDWGLGRWHPPIVIDGESATVLFELCEKMWRQAGPHFGVRRLSTARKWLEDIAGGVYQEDETRAMEAEVGLSELTLFDKRRGSRRSREKKRNKSWWTFHGTADDRINPFLPVRIWAAHRSAHEVIRFPADRRPTGVKTGDSVFFVVLSRQPGGDAESYVVGHARALAYRPLIDDASDEERASDSFLARFPHALRLEDVRFIRGAVGEGVRVHPLMQKLGPRVFESTRRNLEKKSGNIDPGKSIGQKSIIELAHHGGEETMALLSERMSLLGCVTAGEISRYENF